MFVSIEELQIDDLYVKIAAAAILRGFSRPEEPSGEVREIGDGIRTYVVELVTELDREAA